MNCLKITNRTFSNLFTIFNCEDCSSYYIYEYIYIGLNKIHIYKYNDKCVNQMMKNYYTKIILKDIILKQLELNFLILTSKEYIKIFEILPLFINEKNDLYILLL